MNYYRYIVLCFLGTIFLGCTGQQNVKVPSLETTVFPEYSLPVEPINEPLFIPYPFGNFPLAMTITMDRYEKTSMKKSNASISIVTLSKREQKNENTMDFVYNRLLGMENNVTTGYINCSYSINIETENFNNFICRTKDARIKVNEQTKEFILLAEVNLLHTIKKGIKTGSFFNSIKIDLPDSKDFYTEEIVLGLGSFEGQKFIVTKIDIDKNLENIEHRVTKGYALYNLNNLYPVFSEMISISENDDFYVVTKMKLRMIKYQPDW